MTWAVREYGKKQIDRAGQALISYPAWSTKRKNALPIINNWRSCHVYPLQVIRTTLDSRAKRINANALIAQRTKRLSSIAIKLRHNPNMKLSQMQDIGGVRAVMPAIGDVDELVQVYEAANHKNPLKRSSWIERDDYIACPKADGYRSVHLIFKYQSDSSAKQVYAGQRIELQIRSKAQHEWATAVETAQIFTGHALKSKIKTANENWIRFFSLMGTAIAIREKRPPVPNTPTKRKELVDELRYLQEKEDIITCLSGWRAGVQHLRRDSFPKIQAFLLTLDTNAKKLSIRRFEQEEMDSAQREYMLLEEEAETNPHKQVVLVSVDSVDALQKAYPNYYADSSAFIIAVKRELGI